MFGKYFDRVREAAPLIHNITNYVTVNDVANILLACGASPIMADDPNEVEDITSICAGLNINIGTLNSHTVPSMLLAGRTAVRLGHPVLLDPVGAGASSYRTETAQRLLEEIGPDVIRGNISEIRTLTVNQAGASRGVDASLTDAVTEEGLREAVDFMRDQAERLHCVLVVTGAIDLVADGQTCYCIRNGRPEMGKITGTGCQLSGLMTAFLAANPEHKTEAAAAAVAVMGLAGEIGWDRMEPGDGNATYRNRIIDAVYHMKGTALDRGAKIEIYAPR